MARKLRLASQKKKKEVEEIMVAAEEEQVELLPMNRGTPEKEDEESSDSDSAPEEMTVSSAKQNHLALQHGKREKEKQLKEKRRAFQEARVESKKQRILEQVVEPTEETSNVTEKGSEPEVEEPAAPKMSKGISMLPTSVLEGLIAEKSQEAEERERLDLEKRQQLLAKMASASASRMSNTKTLFKVVPLERKGRGAKKARPNKHIPEEVANFRSRQLFSSTIPRKEFSLVR